MSHPHQQHGHGEHHDHHDTSKYLYFAALVLAAQAFFALRPWPFWQNLTYSLVMLLAGYDIILLEGVQDTIQKAKERRHFSPNAHILMGLAAIGSAFLGNFFEGALLILIFAGAHFLEHAAEGRSQRDLKKLLALKPTQARRLDEAVEVTEITADELEKGDHVQVRQGDQVPGDGKIISGHTSLDEAAITGESMPQEKGEGDTVYGGAINQQETIVVEISTDRKDTVFSQIVRLVSQNKEHQTKTATVIERYEPYYVNIVLVASLLLFILAPYLFGWSPTVSLQRGLALLVAASPCALAAATVSASLSATSNLAHHGVLSKGSTFLSQLADAKVIAFDKTGTLTKGQPKVTASYFDQAEKEEEQRQIIAAMEAEANHPLATAITTYLDLDPKLTLQVKNVTGKGLTAEDGKHCYRIGKPDFFANVPASIQEKHEEWANSGHTVVFFSVDETVVAALALMDVEKDEAQSMLKYFEEKGLETVMLTGDGELAGEAIGKKLGLKQVYANILPEEKAERLKALEEEYGTAVMVGDGINDAPALVQADVGIAMGEGTDVALEMADLALVNNQLNNLVDAHALSQKMQRVIWENITIALLVVVLLMISVFTGWAGITLGVIVHEGSTLLVILNGLRLLRPLKRQK